MPSPDLFITALDAMSRTDLEGLRDWYASCIFWSTAAVVAGCALEVTEVLHELWDDMFPTKFVRPIKVISSIGLLLVVLGVAGELTFEHWRSRYEGQLQNFGNVLLASAQQNAGDAKDSAVQAAIASDRANTSANAAGEKAERAESDLAEALNRAAAAEKEADTFAADIASAKKQAADADSHLADALKQAADATAELNRLKSPRTLKSVPDFIEAMKAYRGTEYTFASVYADSESIDLLKEVDKDLQAAGWKRVKAPPGFPAINPYGPSQDFAVVQSLESGVRVSVESSKTVEELNSLPNSGKPLNVAAALALNVALFGIIVPTQEGNGPPVHVDPGASNVVQIIIGKKQ